MASRWAMAFGWGCRSGWPGGGEAGSPRKPREGWGRLGSRLRWVPAFAGTTPRRWCHARAGGRPGGRPASLPPRKQGLGSRVRWVPACAGFPPALGSRLRWVPAFAGTTPGRPGEAAPAGVAGAACLSATACGCAGPSGTPLPIRVSRREDARVVCCAYSRVCWCVRSGAGVHRVARVVNRRSER